MLKRRAGGVRIVGMTDERAVPTEPVSQGEDSLAQISQSEFIAGWKALVGEPPAAMLDSRSEMIRVLVESTPLVPPADPREAPEPPAEADPADDRHSRSAAGFG